MNYNELKKFRESKGWSQKTLAEKLDITTSIVSKWEQGRRNPGKRSLKDLELLGFRVSR